MAFSKKELKIATEKIEETNKNIGNKEEAESKKFIQKTITIDKKTDEKIKKISSEYSVSYSTALRLIINDFLK